MRFRIIFLILKQDMAKFYFRTGKRIASSVAWVYGYDRDNAGFHSPTHHHHLPFPIYYLPVCIEMLVGDINSSALFAPSSPRLRFSPGRHHRDTRLLSVSPLPLYSPAHLQHLPEQLETRPHIVRVITITQCF